MQGNRQNIEFTEAIGSRRFTTGIFPSARTLHLDNRPVVFNERDSFLPPLHLHLNTDLIIAVVDLEIVWRVADYLHDPPAFQSLQDVRQELQLGDDSPYAALRNVVGAAYGLENDLSSSVKVCFERMDGNLLAEMSEDIDALLRSTPLEEADNLVFYRQ